MNSHQTNSFHKSTVDPTALSRNLVVGFLFLTTVIAAGFVLKTGNFVFMAILVALPFVLMLMQVPKVTLVMVLVLNATMLPVPGFSASQLGVLAQMVLAGTYFLGLFMGKLEWQKVPCVERRLVTAYMWLLFVLIAVRGTGLRVLGSANWGGTQYIAQFTAILMFYIISGFTLTKKHIRWVIWASLVASAIGALVTYQTGWAISESTNEVARGRLQFLKPLFFGLFPVAIIVKWGKIKLLNFFLILGCFTLIALTGFRSLLVGGIMVIVGYGFFKAKYKTQYAFVCLLVGLVVWGMLIAVGSFFPIGIQRAISFVPGVHVGYEVSTTAAHSVEWRLEIWKYCMENASEYLLIGRGVTFNVMDVIENTSQSDIWGMSTWFMFNTHSYHSGPMTLLIDFGIPGLIIHFLFTCFAVKRFWGYATRLARIETFEARFALYSCIYLIWNFVSFYLVFGSILRISGGIISFAVVSVLANSVFKMEQTKSSDGEIAELTG